MNKIDHRTLTRAKKDEILKKYDHLCVYCTDGADQVDHVVPWAYVRINCDENLVAACWLCNQIASDKVFDDIAEKQSYILMRRDKWLRRHPIALWLKEDVDQMGRALRLKIEADCLIFDSHDELVEAGERLLKLGFRINTGSKMSEARNRG